jgi:hypothetical protein
VELRGIKVGAGRQPLAPSQQVKLEAVRDTLACLLAEEGFAHEPIAGCPATSSELDPENISRIVQGVLAELRHRGLA